MSRGQKRSPGYPAGGPDDSPPVRVPRYIAPGSSRLHRITGMISPLFSTRTDDGHAHAPAHILPGHNAGSPYEKRAAVCEFSRNRYIACLDIILCTDSFDRRENYGILAKAVPFGCDSPFSLSLFHNEDSLRDSTVLRFARCMDTFYVTRWRNIIGEK